MTTSRYDRAAWDRRRRASGTTVDIADRVELPVDPDTAWMRLRDVEAAAACLPGIVPGSLRPAGGGAYEASLRQSALGVTATWLLRAEFAVLDAERRLDVRLSGEEPRLGMTLRGDAAVGVVASADGLAALDYRGDLRVEGRLAASGRPIVRGVVEQTLRSFVDSLGGREAPPSRRSAAKRVLRWLTRR